MTYKLCFVKQLGNVRNILLASFDSRKIHFYSASFQFFRKRLSKELSIISFKAKAFKTAMKNADNVFNTKTLSENYNKPKMLTKRFLITLSGPLKVKPTNKNKQCIDQIIYRIIKTKLIAPIKYLRKNKPES